MLTPSGHAPQPYSLVFHTGFQSVRLLLIQGSDVIKEIIEENKKVSKTLLCHIDTLLKEHNLRLQDVSYIAATIGPAPLTTLRSTLATINGIAAASPVPLFSLSTFDVLGKEPVLQSDQATLVLLDAFCGEVHYLVFVKDAVILQGMAPLSLVAEQLVLVPIKKFIIKGEQAPTYKNQLESLLHSAILLELDKENDVSSEFLAQSAYQASQEQHSVPQLFPLYLKPAVLSK
jgi:tRNA threonylcarbamoyl adenosine modification protein YeaZ